jgi:hypothetical protein
MDNSITSFLLFSTLISIFIIAVYTSKISANKRNRAFIFFADVILRNHIDRTIVPFLIKSTTEDSIELKKIIKKRNLFVCVFWFSFMFLILFSFVGG